MAIETEIYTSVLTYEWDYRCESIEVAVNSSFRGRNDWSHCIVRSDRFRVIVYYRLVFNSISGIFLDSDGKYWLTFYSDRFYSNVFIIRLERNHGSSYPRNLSSKFFNQFFNHISFLASIFMGDHRWRLLSLFTGYKN